jgi:cytochrome b subunit of formate dehydrogenase
MGLASDCFFIYPRPVAVIAMLLTMAARVVLDFFRELHDYPAFGLRPGLARGVPSFLAPCG